MSLPTESLKRASLKDLYNSLFSIQVRNVPFAVIGEGDALAEDTTDQSKRGSGVSNSELRILNPLDGDATTSIGVRKRKHL